MPTKLGILEDQKYTANNLAYHTIFSLNNYYTMYVLIKYAGSNFLYRILYHFHMTKKIWQRRERVIEIFPRSYVLNLIKIKVKTSVLSKNSIETEKRN